MTRTEKIAAIMQWWETYWANDSKDAVMAAMDLMEHGGVGYRHMTEEELDVSYRDLFDVMDPGCPSQGSSEA